MAMNSRIRRVSKAAGAVTAAAPYVGKLMTDETLRSSVKDFLRSADHLYNQLSGGDRLRRLATDDKVRRDVGRLIGSLQGSARRVRRDTRRRSGWSTLAIGAGLGVTGLATALMYPRTRRGMARVMGETHERASATGHDARDRFSQAAVKLRRAA